MTRKRGEIPLSQQPVPERVRDKLRPPVAVVLGSPAEVVHLVEGCGLSDFTCYQMDLYQAERLRTELSDSGLAGRVEVLPDLWDLPADFSSSVFLPARGGERELKIDMVEQVFHVLRPRGTFVVWSSYEADPFFPGLLKKVFGRVHSDRAGKGTVFWCQREGDRPRRRHEITFQARSVGGPSCRFVTRPGVFSYGHFDEGARALTEVMEVRPGDRIVDIGCGCGTNGVFAALQAGPEGHVAFVDSNVRALALAEHNARANGVTDFRTYATCTVEGPAESSFDVALANPPYYAAGSIAQLFIVRARDLLKPKGRFFLVTRQPNEVAAMVEEAFGAVEALARRGYVILTA
jgi:23S rRNA (guanine1835-N2)-methyltransferase